VAAAEFAKQMLHMPGVIGSFPQLVADAFQMAKANDDFHFSEVPSTDPRNVDPLAAQPDIGHFIIYVIFIFSQ